MERERQGEMDGKRNGGGEVERKRQGGKEGARKRELAEKNGVLDALGDFGVFSCCLFSPTHPNRVTGCEPSFAVTIACVPGF
jgi:hypothetical protein